MIIGLSAAVVMIIIFGVLLLNDKRTQPNGKQTSECCTANIDINKNNIII